MTGRGMTGRGFTARHFRKRKKTHLHPPQRHEPVAPGLLSSLFSGSWPSSTSSSWGGSAQRPLRPRDSAAPGLRHHDGLLGARHRHHGGDRSPHGERDSAMRPAGRLCPCLACAAMTAAASTLGGPSAPTWRHSRSEGRRAPPGLRYTRLVFLYWPSPRASTSSRPSCTATATPGPHDGLLLVNVLHVLMAWPLIYGKLGFPPLG